MDSVEDVHNTFTDNAKITGIHCLLLIDMCLFTSAVLDAHIQFLESWNSKCGEEMDKDSIRAWSTVGYTLRILFTLFFAATKLINLSKFITSKGKHQHIGAFYSPIMSTFLIILIVYNFSSCSQISEIFTISSAKKLISWYSILIIIFTTSLFIFYIFTFITKRSRKSRFILGLKIVIGVLFIIGCTIGVITNLEMIKKGHLFYFAAFDLYSFFICLVINGVSLYHRWKNSSREDVLDD